MSGFPHLELCDITIDVVRQAARLRGQYNLGTPDALHVATSMVNGATVFVTNDHQLRRVKEEIDIVVLSDFI